MTKFALALAAAVALASSPGPAAEPKSSGIPHLDHVFLIVMENHGFGQIIANPNAPFINQYAQSANLAGNYFAVGHPSLTNYLEIVGGSNFGVQSDNSPDWHNANCATNLASGIADTDNPPSPPVCPIAGSGTDAATPAVDTANEVQGLPGLDNIDGVRAYPAAHAIGKTIADQLAARKLSWKSYQQSLSPAGADNVDYSDGVFDNNTNFAAIQPTLNPPLSQDDIVQLYAAKHDPFVYFKSVQEGQVAGSSLANIVGFDGAGGLYADLAAGWVPNFSFVAPNQCNDQHGRGNAGAFCGFDPSPDGTQAGLNTALILVGDAMVRKLVTAIHASPVWAQGNSAIVVVWDENDYGLAPNTNQVVAIVETSYGPGGVQSGNFYTHFSLLKTLEQGFGLPCLNHACDRDTAAMTDLFAAK